jgi:DNA-directed RNA polymerase subunit beta
VTYLALFARINEYGFLEAPYKKVVLEDGKPRITDEIIYLTADDEEDKYITEATIETDEKGFITQKRVPVRLAGDFFEADAKLVNLIDIAPQEIIGTSASLIPFLAHDDANRALMGSHMQCQAVPLVHPESPTVGTCMEGVISEVMGRVIRAPFDAKVAAADGSKIILEGMQGEKASFAIDAFRRTSPPLCNCGHDVARVSKMLQIIAHSAVFHVPENGDGN